jgi:hypothetical protein
VIAPVWVADESERDLTGAAVSSAAGARLVADAIDLSTVYDPRLRRVIAAAIALHPDTPVDLTGCDEGALLGRHLIADGCAIEGELLRRVVGIAVATDESPLRLAEMVVRMPSWPTPAAVGRWSDDVRHAADRRAALVAVCDAERALLDGRPIADAVELVTRLAS